MAPSAHPSDFELRIEKLVPGGDGLAHHEGKVVFVPGVLPGETVRARFIENKKDFARAIAVEILAPSPDRAVPPCPVFGRCGGCDWQHIAYEAQLRHKAAMVEDALRRTGGIAFPGLAIEGGKPLGYRNRIQHHRGARGEAGFLSRASHALVPVRTCPIALPAFDALLAPRPEAEPVDRSVGPTGGEAASRRDVRDGSGTDRGAQGEARDGRDREASGGRRYASWAHTLADGSNFLITDEPGFPESDRALVAQERERALGISGRGEFRSGRNRSRTPEPVGHDIAIELLGKTLRFNLRCFFQSNLGMLEKLIPYALEGLSGAEAMDLYCGVGLFGAFLADKFARVIAVEENSVSLSYAQGNIGATHDFLRGRVEDLLGEERGPLTDCRPNAIVVDPPRDGLDAQVRAFLIAKRPAKLVYVSCNPVTLARDLKSLAPVFNLDDLRLFDFYPQTAHVEAVAKLSPKRS